MSDLISKKCIPCEGGVPALTVDEVATLLGQLKGWIMNSNNKISKEFQFVNFRHTMDFVNKIAILAESEGHHPDLFISYARLKVELYTHAIDGLSENDFIMAAKIDQL
jgi:4a-hydroxytetrahydrobiopterin dehydratase